MSSSPIPVAVLGATGYAGELSVRILLDHPGFELVHVGSDRLAGTAYGEAVPAFAGDCDLALAPDTPEQITASGAQAIVLCKKSPEVTEVVPALLDAGIRIVDVGAEFRLRDLGRYEHWYGGPHACPGLLGEAVYGLSELNAEAISTARVVGNPGCYATSMLLPLIPLVQAGMLDISSPIVAVGYSGLSGAGKRFVEKNNNLFWAMNENLHSYKALAHQHQAEVDQELSHAAGAPLHLRFVPHLAPITRGIHTTISCKVMGGATPKNAATVWGSVFDNSGFVRVRPEPHEVAVANVACTNYCDIAIAIDGDVAVICSAVDNLVKGAAGQAVQNLNLMFGYEPGAGLRGRTIA